MFGKGLEAVYKLKNKIESSIFSSSPVQHDRTIKLSKEQCLPLIVYDVYFHLNTLPTVQVSNKIKEKIKKHYDSKYLQNLRKNALSVEIIGEKYFLFVHASQQTLYNHGNSQDYLKYNPTYLKLVAEIYQNQTMLKHFWSIDFSRLIVLNLSGHRLNSLEGITFMNIPQLQCLELHNNHLQSIGCLSKISTPKLRIITIYSNKIQRCDKLTRLHSNKLQDWEFDTDNLFEDHRVDILEFMFKMKTLGIFNKIYIQDEKRICNKRKIELISNSVKTWKLPESYRAQFINIRHNFDDLILD